MKKLAWVGIAVLVGCGAGCGSDVTAENFPQKYAEALCAKNFQCCDASELTGKTMAMCVSDNQSALVAVMGQINGSLAQHRVSYDSAAAGACVDLVKGMTCEQFKTGVPATVAACNAFVVPQVAMGGACTLGFECTTGNCQGSDPPSDGTCGPAPTIAAIGSSCATAQCVAGAYCDSATATCQAKKGPGEPCTLTDECSNRCDTTTGVCTCYAGCQLVTAPSARGPLLPLVLLAAGLVAVRRRRRA